MNKKIMILLLSLSLFHSAPAQAGFFDFFKSIGVAFSNLFKSTTPPRAVTEPVNTASLSDTDWAPSPALGDDPNNYQASVKVDADPAKAECNPQTIAHRCSHLEGGQVVANSCVNPVAIRTGTTGSGSGVKSKN